MIQHLSFHAETQEILERATLIARSLPYLTLDALTQEPPHAYLVVNNGALPLFAGLQEEYSADQFRVEVREALPSDVDEIANLPMIAEFLDRALPVRLHLGAGPHGSWSYRTRRGRTSTVKFSGTLPFGIKPSEAMRELLRAVLRDHTDALRVA